MSEASGLLEICKAKRKELLWWEICSILHDVGKLSRAFHHYRQVWMSLDNGWNQKDPHDHEWLLGDTEVDKVPGLRSFFETPLIAPEVEPAKTLSVIEAVHEHGRDSKNRLVMLLQLGDRADSRVDRNNPLISNEQTDFDGCGLAPMFRSNVFGYESPRTQVGPDGLDSVRLAFYQELLPLMRRFQETGGYEEYRQIKKLCERCFEPAMSDTTRPANDTSLWEHTYAVATLTKAFHAADLLAPYPETQFDRGALTPAFRLWGIGVDAWRWCSYGHRIGDVTGRKKRLADAFAEAKRVAEFEYPCGNCVYEDDNYQVYLVAEHRDVSALRVPVEAAFAKCTDDELAPAVRWVANCRTTTAVVRVIEKLRAATHIPSATGRIPQEHRQPNRDLCPVCRVRTQAIGKDVCGKCLDRREKIEGYSFQSGQGEPAESRILREIADGNGRLALVVARFGLREWLDGTMVRSCMVTEPRGVARLDEILPRVKELEHECGKFHEWLAARPHRLAGYGDLLAELKRLQSGKVEDGSDEALGVSVFGRGPVGEKLSLNRSISKALPAWNLERAAFEREHPGGLKGDEGLLNAICAKTPTPSTTLDVWHTTREFFHRITFSFERPGKETEEPLLRRLVGQRRRRWLKVETVPGWLRVRSTVEVEWHGKRLECMRAHPLEENALWVVEDYRGALPGAGQEIELRGDALVERARARVTEASREASEAPYWPYCTLTVSPELLMVLVPAAAAPALTRAMAKRYRCEFGKVTGRLPLAVGNIFFERHLPMFSVLDAAWRMVDNFRRLQEAPGGRVRRRLDRHGLHLSLGTGGRDNFHPYAVLAREPQGGGPASAFRTAAGWIAHMEDIGEEEVMERPNLYDGLVLGGSGDRLNMNVSVRGTQEEAATTEEFDREMLARAGEQPVGLMRLECFERLLDIWEKLGAAKAGDGAMRNLWFAMETRRHSWERAGGGAAMAQLGAALGRHYCGEAWPGLEDDLRSGLLWKSLQLHWAILKARLD